ncbi:MAG TPA: hypothetical protein ENK43_06170 [Planctomycetes bacterium]|nr:hypothetical protein [Planctomycetota bacterium]
MSIKRRDFNKMILAATGGILAGATLGCGDKKEDGDKPAEDSTKKGSCNSKDGCSGKDGCNGKSSCSAKDKKDGK